MTTPAAASINPDTGAREYVINGIALPNISSTLDVLASFHLPPWRMKMAVLGVAHRDDLIARVAAAHPIPDSKARNQALREIVEDAIAHGQTIEPGKGYRADDLGSAIHLLAEHVDAGLVDITQLPATVKEHCASYLATVEGHGLEVVVSEATVYSMEHRYAGTLDRIDRFTRTALTDPMWDAYRLGEGCFDIDIKTGTIHDKVAMQLAAHVNAEAIYDAATDTHRPLPEDLRRDVAFALQLTAKGAKLVPVVLEEAWPAFVGALAVQRFAQTKSVGQPLVAPPAQATEVPATSVPEGTESAAVPSAPRAADDIIPPVSSAAVPASATEDRIPTATPTAAGSSAAEVPANQAASNEGGGPERVTVTPADPDPTPSAVDPVHISDPLDAVAHQVALDSAALIFRKHAWLLDRMHQYDDRGRQVLAGYWPAGVQPLKHGIPHTLTELELLTVAVNKTDAELGLPFPDTTDPADRQWNEAPAAAVAAIVERLKALPRDLLGEVTAKLAGSGVPKLTDPHSTIYLAHLDQVDEHLKLAEADAKPRLASLATLTDLAAGNGVTQEQLLAVVGKTSVLECTDTDAELLCDVIDACGVQVVAFDNGVLVPGPQAFAGMKPSEILAAGRAAAKAIDHPTPRSAADAAAAPLLAAVHAIRGTAA